MSCRGSPTLEARIECPHTVIYHWDLKVCDLLLSFAISPSFARSEFIWVDNKLTVPFRVGGGTAVLKSPMSALKLFPSRPWLWDLQVCDHST